MADTTTPPVSTTPLPPTTEKKILADAKIVAAKFATEWGWFTRFLAANPRQTFFIGVSVAFVLGWAIGHL